MHNGRVYLWRKLILASIYEIPSSIELLRNSLMYSEKMGVKLIRPYNTTVRNTKDNKRKMHLPLTPQMYSQISPKSNAVSYGMQLREHK